MSATRVPFVIAALWAFIAKDVNGDEGLVAMHTGTGWTPLVGADRKRIDALMPHAQHIADATGQPMRIVRFGSGEVIGHITPRKDSTT